MQFLIHEYDIKEAADMIVQAHETRWKYNSEYEDMRQKLLKGIEEYHYSKLYKKFVDLLK